MHQKKAKIVCTIGPASASREKLKALVAAGMDVARLNFSHGTHDEHLRTIRLIREVNTETGKPVAILQDLQGPKIRIGRFKESPITLKTGDVFNITTRNIEGTREEVSTTYHNLPSDLRKGDTVLLSDGLIKLEVLSVTEENIKCTVINGGILYDRKGINLPGVKISEPSLTKKDKIDLQFGLEHNVDFVALSFVRDPESLRELKRLIGDKQIPVVAKLEKPEALNKLEAIIQETDIVMVARGDLGVEISPSQVPVVQKRIIEICRNLGVPVITATQMLDSMMINPVPTRAEVSDVANAIFDGSDAVMLSGETAFGKYPVDAVIMMRRIICDAEKSSYFRETCEGTHKHKTPTFSQSICLSASIGSQDIGARCIIVFSESGYTARMLARYRPNVPIVALTSHERSQKRMCIYWGVKSLLLENKIEINEGLHDLERFLKEKGIVEPEDKIIIIAGSTIEQGGTNMLRFHKIAN